MVYKIVKNWISKDKREWEITIYKYNYSHDEMVRYYYSDFSFGVNKAIHNISLDSYSDTNYIPKRLNENGYYYKTIQERFQLEE